MFDFWKITLKTETFIAFHKIRVSRLQMQRSNFEVDKHRDPLPADILIRY